MSSLSKQSTEIDKTSLCYYCKHGVWHTSREHALSIAANTPSEAGLSHEPKHPTDKVAYDITKPILPR